MNTELWMQGFDLASIATWLMIIGFGVLLLLSRSHKSKSSRHASKK